VADRLLPALGAALLFYLFGALPFSYLIVRIAKRTDIREAGSGNVGATNATRVAGRIYGALAFALDFGKGALVAYLAVRWALPFWLAGFAVIGHDWSPWLNFQGGKGVATSLGLTAIVSWPALLITMGIWLLTMVLCQIVSLASIIALLLAPLTLLPFGSSLENILLLVGLGLLSLWRHQGNIVRLIKGEEASALGGPG
jgi:glycerol-3-phosphate acyltransferase PlsY